PPLSPPFPYTTLFRSDGVADFLASRARVRQRPHIDGRWRRCRTLKGKRIAALARAKFARLPNVELDLPDKRFQAVKLSFRSEVRSEEHTSELQSLAYL